MDSDEVERHIRDAGFRPARRNMRYELQGARAG
jgi:cyclic dehypoxanthinyl futalosine synthase